MCANDLPGHLHIPAGLVDEGQVEGDLSPQVHLIVWQALRNHHHIASMCRNDLSIRDKEIWCRGHSQQTSSVCTGSLSAAW